MKSYSVYDNYSSVYEDNNIVVVTNDNNKVDNGNNTSQQKLDDLMDKQNEEKYDYYVSNPR